MHCQNCGQENKEHAKFCEKCGSPLAQEETEEIKKNSVQPDQTAASGGLQNHKKRIIGGAILLLILIACIIGFLLYSSNQKQAEYKGKLQTADKYLEQLDYEKAETAYLEAIDIQPKKEDAYIKLADTYTVQGKYDEAVKTLKTGKEKAGGDKFDAKIKAAEKEESKGGTKTQYKAYYDLCMDYQKKYGDGNFEKSFKMDDALLSDTEMLGGLCVVQLIDFNGDGNEELLLGYGKMEDDGVSMLMNYDYEIWAWNDETLKNILEATEANHDQDVGRWIETAYNDEGLFVVQDYASGSVKYLQYNNKSFEPKYTIEAEFGEHNINGKEVPQEEIEKLEKQLKRPFSKAYHSGVYEFQYVHQDGKILFVPLSVMSTETGNSVLKNTQQNLKQLKNH